MIEYIIFRYGVRSKLFMDNGKSFKGNEIKYFCKKYHIEIKFSTLYYPQGNGHTKSSNKFIKIILSKTIEKHG